LGEEVAGVDGCLDGKQILHMIEITFFEGVEQSVTEIFLVQSQHLKYQTVIVINLYGKRLS